MAQTKQDIELQIESCQSELEGLKAQLRALDVPDWDHMTADQIEYLLATERSWNGWSKCPVGSLVNARNDCGEPRDRLLKYLGFLLINAYDKNWAKVVYYLREITRMRLLELENE